MGICGPILYSFSGIIFDKRSRMQALSLQEKSLIIRLLHTLQWVLQLAGGSVLLGALLAGSLLWQPYADQSELERELANQTYLRVVSELHRSTCVYNPGRWLPFLDCKSVDNKQFTLAYEVLVYEGNPFYYSPFYAIQTNSIFKAFSDRSLPDDAVDLRNKP